MDFGITAGIIALLGFAFAARKASKWDYRTPLKQAKENECREAPLVVSCLLKHFDRLDVQGTGLITIESLAVIDDLAASEADKRRLRHAITNAGPHSFVAFNPWLLAAQHECELTPIGHKIGSHMQTEVASSGATGFATAFDVEVDDYGISRSDLATYVARVNS
jgi:hypothetical protein